MFFETQIQDKDEKPIGAVDTSKIAAMEKRGKAAQSLGAMQTSEAISMLLFLMILNVGFLSGIHVCNPDHHFPTTEYPFPAQAMRAKTVLSKYCDSVLNKSAKIRGLINDLGKNYVDPMATK